MGRVFRNLVSIEDALRILREVVRPRPLGTEEVSLEDSFGRVLAEDVVADVDVPPYDRSLRDGYAVRSIDVSGAREDSPIRLSVVDRLVAGSDKRVYINEGEAVYVATGSPIPGGADAVVMEEYTVTGDGFIDVFKQVSPGDWIQYAGSDVSMGETVLRKGVLIGAREVGILAAIGRSRIKVYVKPRVAILSTGDELVRPGESLPSGKIYDVNAYTISSLVKRDGGIPYYLGIVGDDVNDLYGKISRAVKEYDIVITSGSTSVGVRDNLYNVINSFESVKFIFHGVEVSPGKPTLAALVNGKLFIGLPGFPVSCLMIYNLLFSNIIRGFSGLPLLSANTIDAVSGEVVRGRLGVRRLEAVFLRRLGDKLYFYPVYLSSGAISTLYLADGYVEIGERENFIDRDEVRKIYLFEETFSPADLVIISSHSIALDRLVNAFLDLNDLSGVKVVYSGSFGGLKAIEEGYNDFAGIHILDYKSGEYNLPIIKERRVKDVLLLRGFMREFGLVVARGNPKNIKGLDDIVNKGVRFINRVKGSGTRVFLDIWLKKYSFENNLEFNDVARRIIGYHTQAKTHTSVVYHVESGKADVGIASRSSVFGRRVDFIPIGWEYYDFLINKRSLRLSSSLKDLIEFLSSDEAKMLLKSIPGIKIPERYLEILFEA